MRDARTALRALRRRPGFAAVVIATLAVVIGANTAIFSVVDGVLLRPLPYPEPDRLVRVAALTRPQAGGGEAPFSDRGYWHFVENGRAFERFGGYEGPAEWPLTGEGPPLQVEVRAMTVSAFELLGVRPSLGRLPAEEEGAPEGPQVAILSDALWQTVFGADPSVLGRVIELNGSSWEVIGVMPPDYDFPTPETDLWIPDQLDPASENFGGHHIEGIARLAPGATVASALADTEDLIGRFDEAGYGPTWFEGVFSGEATARTLQEDIVGDAREPLLILFGTAALVLLVACGNIANLFLARAEARARETAVHLALGSGRGALIRFVMAESLILGLVGGALGVLLAYVGTRALVAAAPPMIPRLEDIRVSVAVLAFTAVVSVSAGLLVGLLPALRAGSTKPLDALREGGRGGTAGRGRRRARGVLVTLQVAISLLLVVGSVLTAEPNALVPAVRGIVADMDPDLPITDLRPMDDIVSDSLSRTTFTMSLLAFAAAVALLLGAVGIYGVMSYTVSQRTGELGIRQALGADARNVRRLVVGEGTRLALLGIGLGLAGALLLGRVMQSLLFGVSPYDPIALVAGSVVFFGVALLATLIPSARAVSVAPATALRAE